MLRENIKILAMILLVAGFLTYSGILYSNLPAKDNSTTLQMEGKMTWQRYNCGSCHQVYGLGGYLGPDLTNTYSIKGPAYIRAFLQHGTRVMPDFGLNESEMTALVAYLQCIDQSGSADPRKLKSDRYGNISSQ